MMQTESRLGLKLSTSTLHAKISMTSMVSYIHSFGKSARYDDEPWNGHYSGREGVRTYYGSLLRAMPDLHIEVQQRYASEDAVVLEVIITEHHLGRWRVLLPTGRSIRFPLCGIFTFDEEDRLAGEKIYYDRATVLRQVGIFMSPLGF